MTAPVTLSTERITPFDPPEDLRELSLRHSIVPMTYPDGHVGWLVLDHATARTVLADSRFSARQELRRVPIPTDTASTMQGPADPGMFLRMDPPEHTRYRRALTGQFTVRRMKELTPRVETIVGEHLDAMEAAGPPADLVGAFALPVPSLVICELLGVPYEDRESFQRDSGSLLSLTASEEEKNRAVESLMGYLHQLVLAKRAEPTDDILGGLVRGGEFTDQELATIGFLLLIAGHETTANMLGLGTFTLLQHPDQLAALRDAADDPSVVENAVEELLRYLTIVQFLVTRTATEDVELDGARVEAGQCLTLSLPNGNRDPDRFPDPDRLDVTRRASGHLAFGHGVHQCLGQQLARIEMRVGFAQLLRRFPGLRLAVAPEQVPLRSDMAVYGVHELPVGW